MKVLNSLNNPLIKDVLKLRDKKEREEKGLFIIEGYHLVEEANKAGLLQSVFSINECDLNKFDCSEKYLVNEGIIKKLSSTHNPQGIVGISKININTSNIDNLINKENVKLVILDDVSDPGNMGTIIRTAAGLGYSAVISSQSSVDYYNDKTVRATQGSLYKIPLFKTNLVSLISKLKNSGVLVYGCALYNSVSIKEVEKGNKIALVFGNEAHGINNDILSITTKNIVIPMENDVESLNVSTASAISMWYFKD